MTSQNFRNFLETRKDKVDEISKVVESKIESRPAMTSTSPTNENDKRFFSALAEVANELKQIRSEINEVKSNLINIKLESTTPTKSPFQSAMSTPIVQENKSFENKPVFRQSAVKSMQTVDMSGQPVDIMAHASKILA